MGSLATFSGMARESRQRSGPDVAISRIAARQHGNVTRVQLIAVGLTDEAIAHRVRAGRLCRIHRGVFSVGRPARTGLERASAAVLACGSEAALSHRGALAIWGFATTWAAAFDVTVTKGSPRPPGITVHRATGLLRRDLRTQLGIRTTSPARTVLDCLPGTGRVAGPAWSTTRCTPRSSPRPSSPTSAAGSPAIRARSCSIRSWNRASIRLAHTSRTTSAPSAAGTACRFRRSTSPSPAMRSMPCSPSIG